MAGPMGFESIDGIKKIQFHELGGASKIKAQNSEKVGIIPPYTLKGNSNSLLKMNPYQKFTDKDITISGFDKYASKASDDPQKDAIVQKHLAAASSATVKSGSIQRPTMSVSFYENHKQMQQAFV